MATEPFDDETLLQHGFRRSGGKWYSRISPGWYMQESGSASAPWAWGHNDHEYTGEEANYHEAIQAMRVAKKLADQSPPPVPDLGTRPMTSGFDPKHFKAWKEVSPGIWEHKQLAGFIVFDTGNEARPYGFRHQDEDRIDGDAETYAAAVSAMTNDQAAHRDRTGRYSPVLLGSRSTPKAKPTDLFTPKGQWLSAYGLATGAVERHRSPDGQTTILSMVENAAGTGVAYRVELFSAKGERVQEYTTDTLEVARTTFTSVLENMTDGYSTWKTRPMRGQR